MNPMTLCIHLCALGALCGKAPNFCEAFLEKTEELYHREHREHREKSETRNVVLLTGFV